MVVLTLGVCSVVGEPEPRRSSIYREFFGGPTGLPIGRASANFSDKQKSDERGDGNEASANKRHCADVHKPEAPPPYHEYPWPRLSR
jgi:hypothetical protein